MERISLTNFNKKGDFVIEETSSPVFVMLDKRNFDSEPINILIKKNVEADLLVSNLDDHFDLTITMEENSSLRLAGLIDEKLNTLDLHGFLEKNASFEGFFGDFSDQDLKVKGNIELNGEGASAKWHLAVISSQQASKVYDINVDHNKGNTSALVENYGVAKDTSHLTFTGISAIKKYSKNANTKQVAKIMVFDKESLGTATPKLYIWENDVFANHAVTVGKVDDDQLFYLESRGLSEDEAKRLITLGYLNPILSGFKDPEIRSSLSKLIKESV